LERLIDASVLSQDGSPEHVAQAMDKFQDHFASTLNKEDLIAGFGVMENKAKAKTFIAIYNNSHAQAWLH
jgi:hypothetical protein